MTSKEFVDTSTECAICLEPMVEEEDEEQDDDKHDCKKNPNASTMSSFRNESNKNATCDGTNDSLASSSNNSPSTTTTTTTTTPKTSTTTRQSSPRRGHRRVIQLKCGHKWHLECIQEQLQHASQTQHHLTHSSSKRILFAGFQCAKCNSVCDHEELESWTRTTKELRDKVIQLILEQQEENENHHHGQEEETKQKDKDRIIQEGLRKYAFYLCSSCKEPYFGGTMDCATRQEEDNEDNTGTNGTEQRFCEACAPQPQVIACTNPLEHRTSLIWKCRYCCQPSRYICYGTVHFCSSCHERNTNQHMQEQQDHKQPRAPVAARRRPTLSAIPCPGGDKCPFPKPTNETHHKNGSTSECEQVYGCASCQSRPSNNNNTNSLVHGSLPGSNNLVINPHGAEGMRGWNRIAGRNFQPWQVERSEIPLSTTITTNFVSSFRWCGMFQSINLSQQIRYPLRHVYEVSVCTMGRTDCPSVVTFDALLVRATSSPRRQQQQQQQHRQQAQEILQRARSEVVDTSPDGWERLSLQLSANDDNTNTANTDHHSIYYLVLQVYGKDSRFWQGNFGSKVTNCSVRVLYDNNNNDDSNIFLQVPPLPPADRIQDQV